MKARWTPIGVQRRVQALHAIGWSYRALAEEFGTWERIVRDLAKRCDPRNTRRSTAERVVASYDRLSMRPQHGRGATRARNRARSLGWAPPLAWDDIDLDTSPSTATVPRRRDTLAEWQHLRGFGVPIEEAARRLGVTRGAIVQAELRARSSTNLGV